MALSIHNYQEIYQQAYTAYVQANYEEAANLIDQVVDGPRHILDLATSAHRHFRFVRAPNVLDCLRPGHFVGPEVLDKQAVLGVRPERAVEEIARTDGIDLHAVLDSRL